MKRRVSRLCARNGPSGWHRVGPAWKWNCLRPNQLHNALLRYYQLQQHLLQLQKSYAKITSQLNLANADGHVRPKHASSLPRGVFPVEECDLTEYVWNTGLGLRHQRRPAS